MQKVRVTFVDVATNQVLGQADMPPDQLPESFAAPTTLNLSSDTWNVAAAVPLTRDEYVATGQLRLELHKVQEIDPEEILFSLPTIDASIPACRAPDGSSAYGLNEDDWRQQEFVRRSFLPLVEAEFGDIRAIYADRVGLGFKNCHPRERIPEPLAGVSVSVDMVHALLGDFERLELAMEGDWAGGGLVVGGFAFDRLGGAVYGREVDGNIAVLGLTPTADPFPLRQLARDHDLILVDWVRATIVPTTA